MLPTTLLHRGRLVRDADVVYFEWVQRGQDDDRPVVVLTHGAGGSHAAWFNQVPALASRFRVLTWDSRGFGNSTCSGGTLSAEQSAQDLAAILEEVGVSEAVHLVGQSMGGWWVIAFALANPAQVATLTLSDTPGGVWTPALRDHFTSFRRGGGLSSEVLGRHPALGASSQAANPTLAFLYQELGSFHDPPMAEVGRVLAEVTVAVADVRALGVATLVIAGEEDTIFPPAMLAELARRLDARYVELAGAGHSPYFEVPAAYNAALLDFLT